MNKYILGSGIVGLLAKMIMGQEWDIIPFGKSRFYTWNPSLADNYIIRDDKIDNFVTNELGGNLKYLYANAYSLNGILYKSHDQALASAWLYKYLEEPPQHAPLIIKDRISYGVYDIKVNALYSQLITKEQNYLIEQSKLGKPTKIDAENIYFGDNKLPYDQIISTIPLNALLGLLSIPNNLRYRNCHFCHLFSEELDFEGCNSIRIVDKDIDFFKVSLIAENRYILSSVNDIPNIGVYINKYIKHFDLLDGTMIKESIPIGELPDVSGLHQKGIIPIGMLAEHNCMADLGSNIVRLLQLSGKIN